MKDYFKRLSTSYGQPFVVIDSVKLMGVVVLRILSAQCVYRFDLHLVSIGIGKVNMAIHFLKGNKREILLTKIYMLVRVSD